MGEVLARIAIGLILKINKIMQYILDICYLISSVIIGDFVILSLSNFKSQFARENLKTKKLKHYIKVLLRSTYLLE